jgi:hypothetical protein
VQGALLYAAPCACPDCAATICFQARALTFPTEDMLACAYQTLLYMAHTANLTMTVDRAR